MLSATSREVRLNIYDLHDSNSWLQHIGLGMYHSGLEIGGVEYAFSEAGISQHAPRRVAPEGCSYKTTEVLGHFIGTIQELRRVLNGLREADFAEGKYDVLRRNCNHFCDEFTFALIGRRIPRWVNRAATVGCWVGLGTKPKADGDRTNGVPEAPSKKAAATPTHGPTPLTDKQRYLLTKMREKRNSGKRGGSKSGTTAQSN